MHMYSTLMAGSVSRPGGCLAVKSTSLNRKPARTGRCLSNETLTQERICVPEGSRVRIHTYYTSQVCMCVAMLPVIVRRQCSSAVTPAEPYHESRDDSECEQLFRCPEAAAACLSEAPMRNVPDGKHPMKQASWVGWSTGRCDPSSSPQVHRSRPPAPLR